MSVGPKAKAGSPLLVLPAPDKYLVSLFESLSLDLCQAPVLVEHCIVANINELIYNVLPRFLRVDARDDVSLSLVGAPTSSAEPPTLSHPPFQDLLEDTPRDYCAQTEDEIISLLRCPHGCGNINECQDASESPALVQSS